MSNIAGWDVSKSLKCISHKITRRFFAGTLDVAGLIKLLSSWSTILCGLTKPLLSLYVFSYVLILHSYSLISKGNNSNLMDVYIFVCVCSCKTCIIVLFMCRVFKLFLEIVLYLRFHLLFIFLLSSIYIYMIL